MRKVLAFFLVAASLCFGQGTALNYANSTDFVDCTATSALTSATSTSLIIWLIQNTHTGGRTIARTGTGAAGRRFEMNTSGASGDVQVTLDRTVDLNYITSSTPLSATGSWVFLSYTFNSANAANTQVQGYKGTLSALAAAITWGTTTDGSGALDASGTPFVIGSNGGHTAGFPGEIAIVEAFNTDLSIGQIQSLQFRPRIISSTVGFWLLGRNGTSTQPDYSGLGGSCTTGGVTTTTGVPLGPLFGDLWHNLFGHRNEWIAGYPIQEVLAGL